MFGRRSGGALGDGGQALVFSYVDGVGGSDNVEGVVGLLGESRGFSSLKRKKGSKVKVVRSKAPDSTILPFELIKRK